MKEKQLDYVLVPLGVLFLGVYHTWLLFTIRFYPARTVIGTNAQTTRQWILNMMGDPMGNGVLAIQTIRNSIMASTVLATAAISLSALISVYISSSSDVDSISSELVYGNKTDIINSIKYFTILLCFLLAFLCNVQCIRYNAHVSFLITLPGSNSSTQSMEYVARNMNRGSFFWSLGLRAFYFSFPLFLWVFGPIPMFVCCCTMSVVLYFLDTTTSFTRNLHKQCIKDNTKVEDVESGAQT
ncbi:uncharacterized protein LOC108215862 isoform X1 [Daucus carota subsp. sativus]|uniref:uncharacterized protein LOC108215862 isoform X1 n=1 Tax=Daucus carota subsp. sativus TaxID=79200 RepID=UPI0007EF896C|nr:PREDICTED: uncharacterized protein LOC108215862 isoform X1 [Daucus carota subsp. sativus]